MDWDSDDPDQYIRDSLPMNDPDDPCPPGPSNVGYDDTRTVEVLHRGGVTDPEECKWEGGDMEALQRFRHRFLAMLDMLSIVFRVPFLESELLSEFTLPVEKRKFGPWLVKPGNMSVTIPVVPVSYFFPENIRDESMWSNYHFPESSIKTGVRVVKNGEMVKVCALAGLFPVGNGMMVYGYFRDDIGPRAMTMYWNPDDHPAELWFRYREFLRAYHEQPAPMKSISDNMFINMMEVRDYTMNCFSLLEKHFNVPRVKEWHLHEFEFDPYSVVWGNTFIDNIENNLCFIVDVPRWHDLPREMFDDKHKGRWSIILYDDLSWWIQDNPVYIPGDGIELFGVVDKRLGEDTLVFFVTPRNEDVPYWNAWKTEISLRRRRDMMCE